MAIGAPPQQIAKRVLPSVVLITTEDSDGRPIASGSAFVVVEGVIATNLHVIAGASEAQARIANADTRYDILGVVASDETWDLALLAVKELKAKPLTIGKSNGLVLGDDVYVIGSPKGLEGTFSTGIVSGIRKNSNKRMLFGEPRMAGE